MAYHFTAFIAVIVLNYMAGRYASRRVRQVTFWITATSPLIFSAGLICWFLLRDGFRTFADPHFFWLLMLAFGFTVITAATAFLSREAGRRMAGSQ